MVLVACFSVGLAESRRVRVVWRLENRAYTYTSTPIQTGSGEGDFSSNNYVCALSGNGKSV